MTPVKWKRLPNESEEQFIWRIGQAKDAGSIDMDWSEIARIINEEFRADDTEYRNESAYRKPYQQAKRFYEAGVFEDLTGTDYISKIQEHTRELNREKIKVRTEKIEYARWMREHSRDELIGERIADAIRELPALELNRPRILSKNNTEGEKVGIVCYGDEHFGVEYEVKGLYGEVINTYNPEIFMERMWILFHEIVEKAEKMGLSSLKVYSFGDEIDGILRASQLMKLRYGVVESTIRYAEFMCWWLNELTKHVNVEFHMTEGNHSELRMISQPKGTFTDDNMSRVIKEFIKIRMEDNKNFVLVENATGLIFDNIFDLNVLGIHGEVKNMSSALKDFSVMYDTPIDILIGGHKHHFTSETVGKYKDVVTVPSIIGVDTYSMKIGKTSDAGALFMVIEDGLGITEQHYIKFEKYI